MARICGTVCQEKAAEGEDRSLQVYFLGFLTEDCACTGQVYFRPERVIIVSLGTE